MLLFKILTWPIVFVGYLLVEFFYLFARCWSNSNEPFTIFKEDANFLADKLFKFHPKCYACEKPIKDLDKAHVDKNRKRICDKCWSSQ